MSRSNIAKRATLAARDLFMTGRSKNGRNREDRSALRLSQIGAAVRPDSRVRATRLVAGALALGLIMMTPLAFGAAAYGTQGDCYKIEFNGKQPTTWVSDAHYATVTVKAGQVTQTWTDVQPGQTIGPIIRESNGKPIEFSHIVKCLPVETTTTTEPPTTTTIPEEVTTTTVPDEVTTTTVPEEVTTTTVPEEVTTTTVPEEVTTTTVPEEVTTTTVPEEVTTTTVPEEVTTTTVPEEVTTTTVPEEVTTTTVPEETTTTVPDEVTTTTEPFAVPAEPTVPVEPTTPAEPTVPGSPDPDPVRPIVNARTTSESLPFTGSQHLQMLGMIGMIALAAGFGMIQLVNRGR